MPKKIIFLLSLVVSHQTHAMHTPMEIENVDTTITEKTNFTELLRNIIMLPDDIKRYIFQIMPRESHNEFITRIEASTKNELPDCYYYKNLQRQLHQRGFSTFDKQYIPTGLCPYGKNVAVLTKDSFLKIINTHEHSIIYTEQLVSKCYLHVALSADAQTIATVHQHTQADLRSITEELIIRNITTQKTQSIIIPSTFCIASQHKKPVLAFNTEGTYIILRGIDDSLEKVSSNSEDACDEDEDNSYMPDHLIFPVTINQHMHLLFSLIMRKIMPNSANEESKEKK